MPVDNFQNVVGLVSPPPGVSQQIAASGLQPFDIAVIYFFNKVIVMATVIAGVWVLVNVVLASVTYITSGGDAKAHTQVKDKLTMSVLGLILIIGAYTLTAIFSLLFFGDPLYILNPTVSGPHP